MKTPKLLFIVFVLTSCLACSKGSDSEPTPEPQPAGTPTLKMNESSNITSNSASVSVQITSTGTSDVINCGFIYSSSNKNSTINDASKVEATPSSFQGVISNLSPNTTYYVRAYALNNSGIAYSTTTTFKTVDVTLIYVSSSKGKDTNAGNSWNAPFATISKALQTAAGNSEIWVQEGAYTDNITMKDGVNIYGGFQGTESAISQRDASKKTLLLNCNINGVDGFTKPTYIDGFEISANNISLNLEIRPNVIANNVYFNKCQQIKCMVGLSRIVLFPT